MSKYTSRVKMIKYYRYDKENLGLKKKTQSAFLMVALSNFQC